MKTLYINDIRNALKSKEYWFGFALILVSGILTAVFNLSPTGVFGDYNIGSAEFFISASMYGNTLFKISAPVIAIFACMNRHSIFVSDKKAIEKSWESREMKARILANVTIGASVFLFSYTLLFLAGLIIYPASTGSMPPNYGLFMELYQCAPVGYVFAYIFYNCICGALFALFGFALKILLVKPVGLVLFVPLVFYSSFISLGWLFWFLEGVITFIAPLYTFDISSFDMSPLKRVAELSFILVISITLIIISYRRNKRQVKRENEPT